MANLESGKLLKLIVSVVAVFGISLYIMRGIATVPLPWKLCFQMAAIMAFMQALFGSIAIKVWRP